ncbi:PrsW family intramembrane metalloprotease [candidate division KSB1 bacterium]|nr:PrsW family intramembrane metalloprotease [candidate division KSB1 bacterium]NIR71558.1 PrsW family intramembrane metalloprotease [candidate division KSB1 bacterium]NIS26354.1 PrsW family intramembrane metalloprotease [candidate division KSB1 bacterium]NIT73121.1 PrsW family intramembrane metalloprotease [candidate division KSB1 bacterium]NIU27037.1 PrsW family intramembrane metalloprotease [candidate division KSB1 bacterium]
MTVLVNISISLLPVFIFLGALIVFDSYKLVKLRSVLRTILIGCVVALICMLVNSRLLELFSIEFSTFTKYVSPFTEELLKAAFIVYLIKSKKVGFMVDAAIYGFAVGAGFAFVENIFYLQRLETASLLVWIVRGFGTAVMHGAATAIFAIISKNISDRKSSEKSTVFLPGFVAALLVHSLYNHFILPPILITLSFLIVLPLLVIIVFERSEKATQKWLGVGFDSDVDLLTMITSGNISETRIGRYLQSLQSTFPGEVVADMLCFLRIHLELAVRAKGTLLMRESGFKVSNDPEIKAKFEEMKYLEKSIGKTGKLAILPFLHTTSRDLWQIYMIS